jgi:beta-N-acetylhexosaminidase
MREMGRACTGQPLLVGVDAEGVRVMRLSPAAGYAPTRSHRELGEANDLAATEAEARRIGRMLHEAGIDWNLGPVVDVGYNPANPVIVGHAGSGPAGPGDQSRLRVHPRPAREGVLATLKHFLDTARATDSHLGFVDVTDTAHREVELSPYRALIAEGLADSVMTGHVFNRRLDARYPATLRAPPSTGSAHDPQVLGGGGERRSEDGRHRKAVGPGRAR